MNEICTIPGQDLEGVSTPREDEKSNLHMLLTRQLNLIGESSDTKGASHDSMPRIDGRPLGFTEKTQQARSFYVKDRNHSKNRESPTGTR